jgi:Cof subfamily protein (haloacid dehalogenase superfamily)
MLHKKKFEGKFIISDLDGTLLPTSHRIPQENLDAIKYFTDNGGAFTVATGRSVPSAERYIKQMNIKLPVIVYNGTGIYDYDKNEFLWKASVSPLAYDIVQTVLKEYPDIGVEVFNGTDIYVLNETPMINKHLDDEKIDFIPATLENVPKPWLKVLFIGERERIDLIKERYMNLPQEEIYFVFSSFTFFEMLPFGLSKGTALVKLSEILVQDISKAYAIGDYYNDLDMIKNAGFGVAVDNAPNEIKAAAKLVVGHCDYGAIAELIHYIDLSLENTL